MPDQLALNARALTRFRGIALSELPEAIAQWYRQHPERLGRSADGTLVALSAEMAGEPAVMSYEDELPDEHLALAEEGGYADALVAAGYDAGGGDPPVGFVSETDGMQLTAADLDGAGEEELALAVGAANGYAGGHSEAEVEDDRYGEVIRVTGQNYDDQLKSAGHRFTPPTWTELQAAAPQPVESEDYLGLGRQYDFGVKETYDQMVRAAVSERAEELGLCASSDVDRIVGLASVMQRAGVPAAAGARDASEVARYLAASRGDESAFGAGDDSVFGLAGGGGLVRAAEAAHDPDLQRLRHLARSLGISVDTDDADMDYPRHQKVSHRFHGRPGTVVHSGLRAHHAHLEQTYGGTDKGQPRKGGKGVVRSGQSLYGQSSPGGPEAPSGSAGKPVLSDRSGRVPSAAERYVAPRGKPQAILGMTAGGSDDYYYDEAEFYDGGSAEEILARHGHL